MTSISQPIIPPQALNNASPAVPPAHSPSASTSGRAPSQAAGTASAKSSYASATKKPFSPPPASASSSTPSIAGSAQHGKPDANSPVNGRVAIPPAVPTVTSPTIVNGNTPTNSTAGTSDLSRNPSVSISAAGTSGHMPNGASVPGKPSGGNNIQFGSMNANGSPAAPSASPQPSYATSSLSVNNAANPRATSPQTSPSPIPQPSASGGKPPSTLHGHSNSVSFGNFERTEGNMRPSSTSQGPLAPGPQANHLRRESSQSQHSDMSSHGVGPGGRGGYPAQGNRGRGGYGGFAQQIPYSPAPQLRQPANQSRNGPNMGQYPQQNRSYQYPSSPNQAARSPAPPNAQPVHQQPGPMPMQNSHMAQQPQYGGYPNQPYGYTPNMGPPQGYGVPQQYAPNFEAQMYHMYPTPFAMPSLMPPQSPRPHHHLPPGSQAPFQSQYGAPQPTSMSRTSSAISGTDRPASGMGKPQTTNTAPSTNITTTKRHSNTPAPSINEFHIPKKTAGIVIKNPNSGEVVDLKQSSSPAPSNKSPANVSAAPTPPPRAPSHADSSHSRNESKNVKTDEEKRTEMKEQIAKKLEDDQRKKQEAELKAVQDKKEAEAKLQKEKEEADAKQQEAAKAQMAAEEAAKKDKAAAEEAEKAASKAKDEADAAAEQARKDQEDNERMIAEIEAEEAKREKEEAEAEVRYQQRKAAEAAEAARKEAENFKMEEEEMKRAEAAAIEAEDALLRKKAQAEGDGVQKDKSDEFAAPKKEEPSNSSITTATAKVTPTASGADTPTSDTPAMPPPKSTTTGMKQKPAALKLETHKPVEAAQPTAALMSLRSARRLTSINDVSYPAQIHSPNPALNTAAPMGKFKYDRDFLLQFQNAFTDKPSENWIDKIKETVGETGEPSSARATPRTGGGAGGSMMGGRQPSNRAPPPQMGAFVQGGRTLPPGTSSQQRFEAASRNMPPARPTMNNPLAGFVSKPGAFPQPATNFKMDRTPSSTSMAHPNSPRNASQRGGSQRGSRAATRREDPKDNKSMPLTAGAAVKPIEVSATGWKPRSVGANATGMAGPAPGGDGLMAPDVVQRKVKAALNKMTPEKFDKISSQILEIAHQSKNETDGRSLRQVIQLTFEKATDEAHWAEMYAQFCKRMLESMSPEIKDENILDKKGDVVVGGALFRKYLLTRCQTEFERGWKMNLPDKPEGETEEAVMLSDAYYVAAAAKRRGLGLVRFIGELYKLGMLTERIMHECVKKLVDYEGVPDDAEVESLTSLLRTIGQQLDASDKGRSMMDAYFGRIRGMIDLPDLPSRLRFMLMDIVDLRAKNQWQGKGSAIKGPTTLDAVRQQAVEAERQKEAQRIQENSRKGGGGGRPPLGRGDARGFTGGGQYGMMPPPDYHKNTVGQDELKRLGSKGGARHVSTPGPGGPIFGPATSMFNSARGSNTRKPLSMAQKDDSGASSRVSTPPGHKDKKEREKEEAAKSGANTFSALANLEPTENASPSNSPPTTKSQPLERQRTISPARKDPADGDASQEARTS